MGLLKLHALVATAREDLRREIRVNGNGQPESDRLYQRLQRIESAFCKAVMDAPLECLAEDGTRVAELSLSFVLSGGRTFLLGDAVLANVAAGHKAPWLIDFATVADAVHTEDEIRDALVETMH